MLRRLSVRSLYAIFYTGVSLIPIVMSSLFWLWGVNGAIRNDNVRQAQFKLNQFETYMNNQFNEAIRSSIQIDIPANLAA